MTPEMGIGVVVRVVDESSKFAGQVVFVVDELAENWFGVLLSGHPRDVPFPLWFERYQLAVVPGELEGTQEGVFWKFENPGGAL